MEKIKVWDLPVRCFHWLLVASIIACFYTIKTENISYHQYVGIFVLILVIFRIIWGFVGSSTARFWDFIRTPKTIIEYLRYGVTPTEGHNPIGAFMVLFMLAILLLQTITGLFLGDNTFIHQDSPLYKFVGSDTRAILKRIHFINEYVIYGMVGLHIVAIVLYLVIKGQNLTRTMVIGSRSVEERHSPFSSSLKYNHPFFALIIFVVLSIVIPYMLYGYVKGIDFLSWMQGICTSFKGWFL